MPPVRAGRAFQFERWRSSEIVGFSRARLRAEAREEELNQAVLDLSREDFLAGNFDLKFLFSLLLDRFYSQDVVLWVGAEVRNGRAAAFERMANMLEPINTLLETGLASIVSFRADHSAQDAEGNFVTGWEAVFGGTDWAGTTVRWRTVRAWKSRKVIAERIRDFLQPPGGYGLAAVNTLVDSLEPGLTQSDPDRSFSFEMKPSVSAEAATYQG